MKSISFCLLFFAVLSTLAGQTAARKLDTRVAEFLHRIGYRDLSLDALRAIPIGELKNPPIPVSSYPANDVQRKKITADSIPVLIFNPLHRSNLPVIIHYHGGGFISPLVPSLEYGLWLEAQIYQAIVIGVDYRVAPEYQFPVPLNDSYSAFKWILTNGKDIGADTGRIVLEGNSAGANLVAVITQKAKLEGLASKIKLQVLNGLPGDLRPENMENAQSYQINASGYFHTKAMSLFALEKYAPGKSTDPEVSPMLFKDKSGLPPAVIINAEFDPMRDDGIRYARQLQNAGVRVWEKTFAGQIHLLLGLPADAPEILEMHRLLITAMKQAFESR